MRRHVWWLSVVLTGCGPGSASLEEGLEPLQLDAGFPSDASTQAANDAGVQNPPDAGLLLDAGVFDAGEALDAGAETGADAGAGDAGSSDAGSSTIDAGSARDAGTVRDAGISSRDGGTFVCTQINGAVQSETWFVNGTFDALVGPNTWQRLGRTGIRHWLNPGDPTWTETLVHPCAQSSSAPDRVVQVIWSHSTYTTDELEMRLRTVVTVIRQKVPSARSIVLQPVAWLENCPGSFASGLNQRILDAINRVVGGDVSAGPNVKLLSCSDIADPSLDRLTPAAAQRVAQAYGTFFAP
jgi:hypothetical protein